MLKKNTVNTSDYERIEKLNDKTMINQYKKQVNKINDMWLIVQIREMRKEKPKTNITIKTQNA